MAGSFQAILASIPEKTQSHRGTAFIVESLVLLIFVAASIAIVAQLLGAGYTQGLKADKLSTAVFIASNEAERFTANPIMKSREIVYSKTDNGVEQVASKKSFTNDEVEINGESVSFDNPDIYVLKKVVKTKSLSSGKLYNASISVSCQGSEVYSLDTSKYISDSDSDEDDTDDDDSGDYGEGGM